MSESRCGTLSLANGPFGLTARALNAVTGASSCAAAGAAEARVRAPSTRENRNAVIEGVERERTEQYTSDAGPGEPVCVKCDSAHTQHLVQLERDAPARVLEAVLRSEPRV